MKNILFLCGIIFFYTVSWSDQSSERENSVSPLILKELGHLKGTSNNAHDHATKLNDSTVTDHNILAEEVNGFVEALISYAKKNDNDERSIDRAKESINAKAAALQFKINKDLNSSPPKDKKMRTDPYSMSRDKSFSPGVGMLLDVMEITNVAIDGFFKLIKYFNDKAAQDDFIQQLELRKWDKISP